MIELNLDKLLFYLSTQKYQEIVKWLNINIEKYKIDEINTPICFLRFENEDDAVLFKLRWM